MSFRCWHLLVAFFIWFEIFLVLGIMTDFLLKSRLLRHHAVRIWILIKSSVLVAWFWYYFGRGSWGGSLCYCWVGMGEFWVPSGLHWQCSRVFHSYVLRLNSWLSTRPPLPPPQQEWRCLVTIWEVGYKSSDSLLDFSDITLMWFGGALLQHHNGRSLGLPLGFLWCGWG